MQGGSVMTEQILKESPDFLKEFLIYMETIKGRSSKTIDGYFTDLKLFLKFIYCKQNSIDFSKISDLDISKMPFDIVKSITLTDTYEFLNYTMVNRTNSAKTRARKTSAIRSFFKYLTAKTGLLEDNPVKELDIPRQRKSLPKYLTLEQAMELLTTTSANMLLRDYCIIVLFLNCGMRLSEIVQINTTDISENTLRLLGKGNKERIVYLNQMCLDAIENYIKQERVPPTEQKNKNALFLTKNGGRISPRRVEQIVENALKLAGLSDRGFSPHKLRHTAATLLYQHGNVDIRVLQDMLGHTNLGTTEIYTHISNKQLENAAESSPLLKNSNKIKKDNRS